jgi:hypothetical protein
MSMPFLERRRLVDSTVQSSDSQTYQKELPKMGDLAALEIMVDITNGATSNITETPYDAIDRIELIGNGNFVIFSLTGQNARQWAHAHLKQRPRWVRDESAGAVQRAHFYIPFGLSKYDPNHWLPLAKFSSVELRITYSPTIAATGFATGTTTITVYGYMWAQGTPGQWGGYLRCTEQKYFTSAASGVETVPLNTDNDILAIGIRVYEAGIDAHVDVDEVEINVNSNSWIPVKGEFEDLAAMYAAELGINGREYGLAFRSDAEAFETFAGTLQYANILSMQAAVTVGTTDTQEDLIETVAGGQITLTCITRDAATTAADAANTTDHTIFYDAQPKFGIGDFLVIPFGIANIGQALQGGQYGNIDVKLTQGGAGAEVRVSVLELVKS